MVIQVIQAQFYVFGIALLNWLGPDAITAKWVALLRWVASVRGATQEGRFWKISKAGLFRFWVSRLVKLFRDHNGFAANGVCICVVVHYARRGHKR